MALPLVDPTLVDLAELLAAVGRAPSVHNTQPWRLRWTQRGLQLLTQPVRKLLRADPDGRDLRLSCGAALLNLRLAMAAGGRRPAVRLLPDRATPELLAEVLIGEPYSATAQDTALHTAIPLRRSYRGPMRAEPVAAAHRHLLRRAAEQEGVWLGAVASHAQQAPLIDLVHRAVAAQRADPRFRAESRTWTGRPDGERVGVPLRCAATGDDPWMARDFRRSRDEDPPRPTAERPAPLVLVIATSHDLPVAQLRAGQALQRVLLTATVLGLATSVLSAPVEVPAMRLQLARRLGRGVHPQILVRVGHPAQPPAATTSPRLRPDELWG